MNSHTEHNLQYKNAHRRTHTMAKCQSRQHFTVKIH